MHLFNVFHIDSVTLVRADERNKEGNERFSVTGRVSTEPSFPQLNFSQETIFSIFTILQFRFKGILSTGQQFLKCLQ